MLSDRSAPRHSGPLAPKNLGRTDRGQRGCVEGHKRQKKSLVCSKNSQEVMEAAAFKSRLATGQHFLWWPSMV